MKLRPLLALVLVLLLTGCTAQPAATSPTTLPTPPTTVPPTAPPTEPSTTPSTRAEDAFCDTLFIGDSRTVGLMEYGGIQGADFFATVGMNVFKLTTSPVCVSGVGDVTLSQLLESKQYTKIYLMTGINELGYPMQSILARYKEAVDLLRRLQPQATVILGGNLRVTQALSNTSDVFTNQKIDALNSSIAALADNRHIFYLDVNPLFDDGNGNLDAKYASDNTHLEPKHYKAWASWLTQHTPSHT